MAVEIITKDDLNQFRSQLLAELKELMNQKQPLENQWLKSSEVRKLLKMSPGTLQNLRINGTLKYSQVGGNFYYNYEDIQNMLLTHKK